MYYTKERKGGSIYYSIDVPKELRAKECELSRERVGYMGILKKKKKKYCEESFHLENLNTDINNCVKSCLICQPLKFDKPRSQ